MSSRLSIRPITADESEASKETWMYERAEEASNAGLPLDLAI